MTLRIWLDIVASALIVVTAINVSRHLVMQRRRPVWQVISAPAGHTVRLGAIFMLFGVGILIGPSWPLVAAMGALLVWDVAILLRILIAAHRRRARRHPA
jgi:hypothetical protein